MVPCLLQRGRQKEDGANNARVCHQTMISDHLIHTHIHTYQPNMHQQQPRHAAPRARVGAAATPSPALSTANPSATEHAFRPSPMEILRLHASRRQNVTPLLRQRARRRGARSRYPCEGTRQPLACHARSGKVGGREGERGGGPRARTRGGQPTIHAGGQSWGGGHRPETHTRP